MSCLAGGLRGNPASLGAALSIGWMCECLGPWHRGCQHSLQHAKHSAHTRTHTRAYQSWPQHRECLPTSLPACLPAGGREAWVAANRDNQCALSCLSCSFMLSLSMRSPGAGVCVRHACCLIRGKFHVTFRWRSLKGCFGV